eukprot:gene9835-7720_t
MVWGILRVALKEMVWAYSVFTEKMVLGILRVHLKEHGMGIRRVQLKRWYGMGRIRGHENLWYGAYSRVHGRDGNGAYSVFTEEMTGGVDMQQGVPATLMLMFKNEGVAGLFK